MTVPTRIACVSVHLLEELLILASGAGLSHPKSPQENPIHPLNLMSGSSALASLDYTLSGYVTPPPSSSVDIMANKPSIIVDDYTRY